MAVPQESDEALEHVQIGREVEPVSDNLRPALLHPQRGRRHFEQVHGGLVGNKEFFRVGSQEWGHALADPSA